jgi:demethylmenaquinone methyltransferase/2-methoxy-6-polyprenyl-1,4-benzoquinol methylase
MYYDSIAPGYNELHQAEQEKKIASIIKALAKIHLPPGDILDVGAGTGFSLKHFSQATHRTCIGIEPSTGMIAHHQGPEKLIQGIAENLPFPDESFALVVSITAIQNFDNIPQGIAEMKRVTKKNGYLFITCLKKSPKISYVTASIGELLIVLSITEEEKDLIFCCKRSI